MLGEQPADSSIPTPTTVKEIENLNSQYALSRLFPDTPWLE